MRCKLAEDLKKSKDQLVAVLGDSRTREGFSAKIFDEIARDKPLKAVNLTISGSTPRVWYYLLEEVDPDRHAFRSIVIGLPSYLDQCYCDPMSNAKLDLQILLPILKLSDTYEFVTSFADYRLRPETALACCLRMYGYRWDIKDFFADPLKRLSSCRQMAACWQTNDYLYSGNTESLKGAKISNGKIVNLPGYLSPFKALRLRLEVFLGWREIPPNHSNYFSYWLYRIANRYQGTSTKIIIIHPPENPFPCKGKPPLNTKTIEMLSQLPNVFVDPANQYVSLQRPEYFYDDIHLNRMGRALFSNLLSRRILKYLEPSAQIEITSRKIPMSSPKDNYKIGALSDGKCLHL